MREAIRCFTQHLKSKRYTNSTIEAYKNCLEKFFQYTKKTPEEIDTSDIEEFMSEKLLPNQASYSAQKQMISALKLFFSEIHNKSLKISNLPLERKKLPLPTILSKKEVCSILQNTANLKHQAILATTYSAGLRISEVINLRVTDIDWRQKKLMVSKTKDFRDRKVKLSDTLGKILKNYLDEYSPNKWLFEGRNKQKYSTSGIRNALEKSVQKSKIKKNVTVQVLRHSYAVHMLEDGINLEELQEELGHYSIKTTQFYAKFLDSQKMEIKNPLDDFSL